MDPFLITGPAAISFSGGRTSGYMLRRVLDAHGGALPPDVHVVFANTGKEREATLAFVRECGERWGVAITWLEYAGKKAFRVVDFKSASRHGEPFEQVIRDRRYLPNAVTRFCTVELKIHTLHRWLRSPWVRADGAYDEWTNVVGLRADEPSRVAKVSGGRETEAETVVCPLATAGVTKEDVLAFWSRQPFDLRLRPWEGNCDLCFLKGQATRERIMLNHPETAAWWIAQEAAIGATFRAHSPSYAAIERRVRSQGRLPIVIDPPDDDPTDIMSCACTD